MTKENILNCSMLKKILGLQIQFGTEAENRIHNKIDINPYDLNNAYKLINGDRKPKINPGDVSPYDLNEMHEMLENS